MEKLNKDKVSAPILYVSLLAFIAFMGYVLYVNQEVLYMAHSRSEFLYGEPFFNALMSKPFGLMQYVGAWLTQFCYYPALGAGMLAVLWTLIFFVGIKAFRLKGSAIALMILPVACLLTSVVDLGYWVYTVAIRGYWFSQSVAFLIMLLLLWAARSTPRKWHLVWYIAGFCLYPVLGWFSLLFILCLALYEKVTWCEVFGLFLVFLTGPLFSALLYSNQKADEIMMAGLPKFENPADVTESLSIPFWILGLTAIIMSMCSHYLAKRFVPVLCTIAAIAFTWSFMFRDSNYITEMRVVRAAEADDWKEVLNIYSETSTPTLSMVMMKNIALMNEGGLLDRSFKLSNEVFPTYNPDSLKVSFLEIGAPVAYYNYGMLNEGFRLNFECAEQSGFSPLYLKMMTRNAFANGETKLVERYKAILHKHPFYHDWEPAPVSKNVRDLSKSYPDELSGVESSYSYIINSICFWNQCSSKVASEQALFYAMMRCDSHQFWEMLRQYLKLHIGDEFPVHAQEAFIMYTDKAPEEKKLRVPVSQEVYNRYKKFWESLENHVKSGISKDEIKDKMQEEYGDTYWYYNIFAKKIL